MEAARLFVGEIIECRSIRSGEVRHDQHGPHFLERTQIIGQLSRFIHAESQPGHAGIELDGNRQRLRPSRQMALRKDPLKAFPAMDQRRDIVACGESRVFIPCQSHQGEQESRMPLLPEQCAFPHGTHRHMLYPLFRQYARDGDDAVPVGVGLDDRHERRVAVQQCFQVMPKVFKVDGDDGTAQKHGTSTLKRFAGEKTGTRILDGKRAWKHPPFRIAEKLWMNRKKDPLFFAAPRRRGITEGFFCLKNGLEYTPHEPEHEAALFFKRHPREGGRR